MKQIKLRGMLSVLGCMLFTSVLFAEDTSARYSFTATRGQWPVNQTGGETESILDSRYVQTGPALTDLKTLADMKATIAAGTAKYIAVLFTAWDWCEVGSRLLVEWRQGLGDDFVTTIYDWPEEDFIILSGENVGTNVSSLSRQNDYAGTLNLLGGASSRMHVWPAVGLYDGEGRLFALERGIEYMDNAALRTLVADRVANYDAFLTKKEAALNATADTLTAAATAGDRGMTIVDGVVQDAGGRTITLEIYQAALMADALVELEKNIYDVSQMRGSAVARKSEFDQIQTWDKADVSGAWRRLTVPNLYGYSSTYYSADKTVDDIKASLYPLIDNTRIVKYSDNEYQQALLCGYTMYRKKVGDWTSAEVYARKAIEQNPSSFWGEGARGRLLMDGKGPVTFGFGWKPYHLTEMADITAADTAGTIDAATIYAQDGLTLDTANKTFKWTMRYGTDYYLRYQGWHNVTMKMGSGSDLTINSFKIYIDTASKDDPTTGTLLFDGTAAVNSTPTNGDDMATFTEVTFPYTVNTSTPLSFNFYLPKDAQKLFPLHEKDWSGNPLYNDVAVVIEGAYAGTSTGSFSVNPVQTPTAQTAPSVTQIVVDSTTMSIADVLSAQQTILNNKTPNNTVSGEAVADAVELLLTGSEDGTVAADEDYITALTRANFFYEHESARGFAGIISEVAAQDKCGVDMLNAVMADRTWMTDLMISGPAGTYGTRGGGARGAPKDMLHRLAFLWRLDKIYTDTKGDTRRGTITAGPGEEGYDALIRRMATVGALNAAPIANGNLGQNHWVYRDQIDRGVMHGDFFVQTAAQMRFSLNPTACTVLDIAHAVKTGNTRMNEINGTAWQTAYNLNNFFGDSIHGADYYRPWGSTVLSGTALGREIGAVCGGISYYGVLAGNASGRRTIPGGQPAHCAGMHLTFDGSFWEIDSNIGSPTGNHFPLWENGFYQAMEYYDDMWSDPKTLTGYRLLWAARLRALTYGDTDPGVEALYHRAVTYAPLCYQAILDYRTWLKTHYPNDADRWLVWAEAVTNGLWRYPYLAWNLLNAEIITPLKAQYGEEGALIALKQIHARMHYSDRKTRERFNYIANAFTPQIKHFTDTNLISLVGTAMDVRYGTERFNNLVNWGNSYYTSGTEAYTAYQTMLQSVYEANGNPLGVKLTCLEALMDASKEEDVGAFTEMSALYANLFHQDEEYPILSTDTAPYSYPLVSAEGMITLSSYPELYTSGTAEELHESALAYCHAKRLIDDSAAGTYSAWTQEQYEDPWMVVQLKGDSEIYGIIIQNAEGSVPLTVEISPDADTWTTLIAGRVVGEGQTINIPADGSTISKYVRVRYSNTSGEMVRLKLNKIQVYAKKRY